jgi:hypothetical protein
VIQKMFEHGTQVQKSVLANTMEGHILTLSTQLYGCRVVQKVSAHDYLSAGTYKCGPYLRQWNTSFRSNRIPSSGSLNLTFSVVSRTPMETMSFKSSLSAYHPVVYPSSIASAIISSTSQRIHTVVVCSSAVLYSCRKNTAVPCSRNSTSTVSILCRISSA